ncbi:MAG: hypothetical protein ACO3RB_04280 [Ilumatobacteraceae bacterium]
MGLVKWWLVYRIATRGKRRRNRARASLVRVDALTRLDLAAMGVDPDDVDLDETCPDCGAILAEHLITDDGLECP